MHIHDVRILSIKNHKIKKSFIVFSTLKQLVAETKPWISEMY